MKQYQFYNVITITKFVKETRRNKHFYIYNNNLKFYNCFILSPFKDFYAIHNTEISNDSSK